METLILTLVGPARAVVPRRVAVELRAGDGRLHLPEAPALDDEWRLAAERAWAAAVALADARGRDAFVAIPGAQPLVGASAGLPLGILFGAALSGRAPAPHFASGAVTGSDGKLDGGASVPEKARAAVGLAAQLGMKEWRFVAPPRAPDVDGVPLVRVPDLRAALAALGVRH